MSDVGDTKSAAQIEAEGGAQTASISWCGFALEVPALVDDLDIDTLRAFETGRATVFIEGLLGTAKYRQLQADFRKKTGRKILVRDLRDLGKMIAELYGFESEGE